MSPEFSPTPPLDAAADRRLALSALRAKVRALETGGRAPVRFTLGDPAVDAALPGGGLEAGALHAADGASYLDQPAAVAFLAALAARALAFRPGGLVWIRSPGAFDFGAPYAPGLAAFGLCSRRTLHVRPRVAKDALWAAEEALRAVGTAAVLLETGRQLSSTAVRRLQLAAEAGGGIGLALGPMSAARSHWTLASQTSAAPEWAGALGFAPIHSPPGLPRWRAQVRGADGRERRFCLEWRYETGGFHSVAALADGSAAPAKPDAAAA